MQIGNLSKFAMTFLGICFALMGASCLVISAIGDFSMGRTVVVVMGFSFLVIAMPFFAFLYSRRLTEVLGVVGLLAFAAAMLWLTFRPTIPVSDPTIYQVAAIALAVLLVARVALRLRGKRSAPGG